MTISSCEGIGPVTNSNKIICKNNKTITITYLYRFLFYVE